MVGTLGYLAFLYAKGYRFNPKNNSFSPNGLLVLKSIPDGASIFINGELETATNATLPLSANTYDISVKKEGYATWNKRLTIKKEIVTEETAFLFKIAPTLSAATFNGVINPVISNDLTKIAYVVPPVKNDPGVNEKNSGLWIMETVNLPLGFARDPRRIADGDLLGFNIRWSPDDRQILLSKDTESYIFDTGSYTAQNQRVNVFLTLDKTLIQWESDTQKELQAGLRSLPAEFKDILERKTSQILFSPDKDMILYVASSSASLPANLISPVPGASTQKEDRDIKENHTYVYNIKEDRNFMVDSQSDNLTITPGKSNFQNFDKRILWFPTSRHLILAENESISIIDYDNTNKQVIYMGAYISPEAFPTLSTDRIMFLTNLGANSAAPNLYSISLR